MGGVDGIRNLGNKGTLELRRFMTYEENWHQNFELLKAYKRRRRPRVAFVGEISEKAN